MSINKFNPEKVRITAQPTGNYTIDLYKDNAIDCSGATANMQITVPQASTLPQNGLVHSFYIINNSQYEVTIQLSASNVFPSGNSKIVLHNAYDVVYIGGAYNSGTVNGWMSISDILVVTQARRAATWDASNFSSFTAIPFDTTDVQLLDQIIEHETVTNPTRLTAKTKGLYRITYWYDIDSTGGSTYVIRTRVMKNSALQIDGLETRTGNYGNEDQSGCMGGALVYLDAGDFIEVHIDQNSLTGNLRSAICVMEVTI